MPEATASGFRREFQPNWEEAERMRSESLDFLQAQGFSHDIAFALSMTTCELVENAVKYGAFTADQSVQVQIEVNPTDVTIEVRNPVDRDSPHLLRLDRIVQWVRGFQNPFQAYLERLQGVSGATIEGESGLGLVRIAYEAQAILDFYVDEEDILALSAVYQR